MPQQRAVKKRTPRSPLFPLTSNLASGGLPNKQKHAQIRITGLSDWVESYWNTFGKLEGIMCIISDMSIIGLRDNYFEVPQQTSRSMPNWILQHLNEKASTHVENWILQHLPKVISRHIKNWNVTLGDQETQTPKQSAWRLSPTKLFIVSGLTTANS